MKVILRQDVEKVGEEGTVVDVKKGFAQNYLFPRNLAVEATPNRVKNIEHERKLIEDRKKRETKDATDLATRIENCSCKIHVRVGEEEKLFGSVTTSDIAEAVQEQCGIELDKKKVSLDEPIKALGVYVAHVKVGAEVSADLKVWVEKQID